MRSNNMSNLILLENEGVSKFMNQFEPDYTSIVYGDELLFKRETAFVVQIMNKNEYLMNIARNKPQSFRDAVINSASIGLSLNPSAGLAYLVPRKNEVCLDISYMGLIKLAQDAGAVKDVKADIVYQNDEFMINGVFDEPTHKYNPFSDRGNIVGAYVVARTIDDTYLTTVMDIKEINEIKESSESWKNPKSRAHSPWFKHAGEMIKKTVIRRAYKMWPKTTNQNIIQKAINLSDDAQGIEFKSDYQIEQDELDKDFPIDPALKVIGSPDYMIQNAKHRGKQLKDIDESELEDYFFTLEKRHEKNDAKGWELEIKSSISKYLSNLSLNENQIGEEDEC